VSDLLVIDASAVILTLVGHDERGLAVAERLCGVGLVAPDVLGYEVMNGFRGLCVSKKLSKSQARRALDDWHRLGVETWSLSTVEDRVWALADNLTAYDAAYVALAERLEVPLLTGDRRLATAPGIKAEVVVV
jgi:predicted nucleic acid-binding protein